MASIVVWMLTVASVHAIAFATPCEIGAASCVVNASDFEAQEVAELGGHETNLVQFKSAGATGINETTCKAFHAETDKWCKRHCNKKSTVFPLTDCTDYLEKCHAKCYDGCACLTLPAPTPLCTGDTDCNFGKVCTDGVCRVCTSSDECLTGYTCKVNATYAVLSRCKTSDSFQQISPPTGKSDEDDWDCRNPHDASSSSNHWPNIPSPLYSRAMDSKQDCFDKCSSVSNCNYVSWKTDKGGVWCGFFIACGEENHYNTEGQGDTVWKRLKA